MGVEGWPKLLAGWPWYRGEGRYPLPAYSEVTPPARLVRKPYGEPTYLLPDPADPFGWPVSEYEEAAELRPGLHQVGRPLLRALAKLAEGQPDETLAALAKDNPAWPAELARAGALQHERYVLLLPMALSRTQTDEGQVRWTLFGGSEQGPARAFWRSFFTSPARERPEDEALFFFRRLLHGAYAEPDQGDPHAAGLRFLPDDDAPKWAGRFRWEPGRSLRGVKYLLTFRPFAELPAAVRRAYRAGELHLLPCPASLLFWGAPGFDRLRRAWPLAWQVPFQLTVARHDGEGMLRVEQSGWTEDPAGETYRRAWPHRGPEPGWWGKSAEGPIARTLFDNSPDAVALYNKPTARKAQLWAGDFRPLLDGPHADRDAIHRAEQAFDAGGRFGYRFVSPPMQVGPFALFWHRPLVAYRTPSGRPHIMEDGPTGYLTAYPAEAPDPSAPALELWPRLLSRELYADAVRLLKDAGEEEPMRTLRSVLNLLEMRDRLGWDHLPSAFARRLIAAPKRQTLAAWLGQLPEFASDKAEGKRLAEELLRCVTPASAWEGVAGGEGKPPYGKGKPADGPLAFVPVPPPPAPRTEKAASLTFGHTARRRFEVEFWKLVAWLSGGTFANRNNADPCLDEPTIAARGRPPRDLDALADALLDHHRSVIAAAKMTGRAHAGDVPFRWDTAFDYPWMGGWAVNRNDPRERDLVVVIPGRDRSRAVVMADHYDTAYRSDRYQPEQGGDRVHVAAPGSDDNSSATATLLLAAPIFLELSRRGELGCDVWLIHLTGEEFPADGLGARHLCHSLVEGTLRLRTPDGELDLSETRVCGAFVLDMVAHNRRAKDVFQISPGAGPTAAWLAYQAHLANEAWNAGTAAWNRRRKGAGRSRRSTDPAKVPPAAKHLALFGELRPDADPRSTLYNADAQDFSDAGVPAVLLMEDYDQERAGYHDSRDNVGLIDLDYGAALAAIAIESVARAARFFSPLPLRERGRG